LTDPGGASPLTVLTNGPVRTLVLNRPERLNAVSLPMYRALSDSLATIAADAEVRAVILTGAGRAFCAGADVKAYRERAPSAEERRAYLDAGEAANRALQDLPQPVVAAVNGHAVGAGLELALSCDLIIVLAGARLRFPEVALGSFIGGGASHTLSSRVGLARAADLVLTARFFSGAEAVAMGLANAVADSAEEVVAEAGRTAATLARHAPISMRLAKRALRGGAAADRDAAHAFERAALADCMASQDWLEGVRALGEGREPEYRGR
jgi:enoyl-CoA hydratase/carnithine racemase